MSPFSIDLANLPPPDAALPAPSQRPAFSPSRSFDEHLQRAAQPPAAAPQNRDPSRQDRARGDSQQTTSAGDRPADASRGASKEPAEQVDGPSESQARPPEAKPASPKKKRDKSAEDEPENEVAVAPGVEQSKTDAPPGQATEEDKTVEAVEDAQRKVRRPGDKLKDARGGKRAPGDAEQPPEDSGAPQPATPSNDPPPANKNSQGLTKAAARPEQNALTEQGDQRHAAAESELNSSEQESAKASTEKGAESGREPSAVESAAASTSAPTQVTQPAGELNTEAKPATNGSSASAAAGTPSNSENGEAGSQEGNREHDGRPRAERNGRESRAVAATPAEQFRAAPPSQPTTAGDVAPQVGDMSRLNEASIGETARQPEHGKMDHAAALDRPEAATAPTGDSTAARTPRFALGVPTTSGQSSPNSVSDIERVRFVQRVARAFHQVGEAGGEVRLRLSPPELGSLRLEVTMRDGVLTARMEAENEISRSLLIENLPTLRERLISQDVRIERFDVELLDRSRSGPNDGNTGQGTSSEQQSKRDGAQQNARQTAKGEAGPSASRSTIEVEAGRVNVII